MRRLFRFSALLIFPLIAVTISWVQANSFETAKNTIIAHDSSDGNPAFAGAWYVVTGDIDGDGRQDVVGGAHHSQKVSWFRNVNGDGSAWAESVIVTGFNGFTALGVADFDGDSDLDVVAVAENIATVAWFANPCIGGGGCAAPWAQTNIDTAFANPSNVAVGDMDGDGDMDVVATRTNITTFAGGPSTFAACPAVNGEIAWWANNGGMWTKTTVDVNFPGVTGVAVGDLDGDGDLDITGAAVFTGCTPGVPPTITGTVSWYANSGGAWVKNIVDGALNNANSVAVARIDGDGDLDIVAGATHLVGSFTGNVGELVWYSNAGGSFGSKNAIDTGNVSTVGITTADLDGDGDLDVAAAAPISGQVNWFANTGGNGVSWTKSLVGSFPSAISVAAADLDGDGDRDITAARGDVLNENFGEVAWWRYNRTPVIGVNTGMTVLEGFSASITSSMLQPFDDSPPGQLIYTLTSLPDNGTLELNDNPMALNATFTQQDLIDANVSYTHNGSETTSDSFGFSLTDGGTVLTGVFSITVQPVDDATLPLVTNPGDKTLVGSLTSGEIRPSIVWLPSSGNAPQYYNVLITDSNGDAVLDLWFAVSTVCPDTPCVFTPTFDDLPAGLLNGSHTLTIRQYANGNTTSVGSPLAFEVDVPVPVIQPSAQVNTNQGRPSLVFNDDPGTTWLQVWIGTKSTLATAHYQWYRKADALCNGTTCELHLGAHLLNGTYTLYFQAWGPGGFNDNDPLSWNGAFDFNLSFGRPAAVQPLTPTVSSGTPTLTWQASEGATWYQVWLGTLSPVQTHFTGWLAALDLGCGNLGVCMATLNGVSLPAGSTYEWYIQAWGPGGLSTGGIGGAADGWVGGDSFTP